jgi:hypothetical protein
MPNRAHFLKKALRCLEEKDGTGLHEIAIDLDVEAYDAQLEAFTEKGNRIVNELFGELTRACFINRFGLMPDTYG